MSATSLLLVSVVAMVSGGACSFPPSPIGVAEDGGPGGDGTLDPDAEPAPDAVIAVVPCATPDPTDLVLCLELEDGLGDGTLSDSSPAGRDAVTSGLVPAMRTAPAPAMSMAAVVGAASSTYVPQSPALDLAPAYTLAVWIRPDSLPTPNDTRGILDHENQYAMLIGNVPSSGIENRCVHTGIARYEFTESLPVSTWSFLACTWNGTQLCAYRWTSATDNERYCHTPALTPSPQGAHGLSIGHLSDEGAPHSRFDGAFDSVQVYRRGLSEPQLCALIGEPPGCMPCDACT